MGLFGKEKKQLPELMTAADYADVANYESALNYLIGLSDDEYKKVTDVATIHRKAYQEAAAVLGTANEPTTFITPPEPEETPEDEPDFLDDLINDKPKSKGKKITVKE